MLPGSQHPKQNPSPLDDSHSCAQCTSTTVSISSFGEKATESSTARQNDQISTGTLCSELDVLEKAVQNPHANSSPHTTSVLSYNMVQTYPSLDPSTKGVESIS